MGSRSLGALAWLLAGLSGGCATFTGGDGGNAPDVDTLDLTGLAPTLVFLADDASRAPVLVPCDDVRILRIANLTQEDQRVDTLDVTLDDGLILTEDLHLPRIVGAGHTLDIPILVEAESTAALTASIAATSTVGPITGEATFDVVYVEERDETFTTGLPLVDVILAVDHSGAMASDYGEELGEGIDDYLDALGARSDWRLILVTDDTACNNGGVFDGSDPGAAAAWIADHAFDPSPESDHTEALLQLASDALAENATSECNYTFRREEAQLHVIAVSDEPEQSGRSWSFWVDDFEVYADEVRVSGIVDVGNRCGQGANGYDDAADATDGVLVDICDRSFGRDLADLADAVDELPAVFTLAAPAMPDSIVAKIAGKKVDVSYDPGEGTITVPDASAPGTVVDVSYGVGDVCAATPTR